MMMDDIYFSDPVECPDCHKRCEWGFMIWLNGHCTCPECYEKRRIKLDQNPGKRRMKRLHIHIWDIPCPQTKLKLGSFSSFYEECSICGKLRLIGGAE